jgi:uncharacterized protein YaaQ
MKLVIAIVHDRDRQKLADGLVRDGIRFTRLASTGGFLREGNTTFLVAVEEDQVEAVLKVVDQSSKSREQYVNLLPPDAMAVGAFVANPVSVPVGGAVVFVLPIDRFEKY